MTARRTAPAFARSDKPNRRGPVYLLRLQAKPDCRIHDLRAILKLLGRRYRLRCIRAREERQS
jgi:hypothetical protein